MTMRTFDRRAHWDPRNDQYPIRALLEPDAPLATRTWECGTYLDQGSEGACVGHGWAHEAAARPHVIKVTEQDAMDIYHRAQQLDEWPGEDYEGTSVLAGAKAQVERGWLHQYRWATNLDDVLRSLSQHGPVVLGITWKSGMWDTDAHGMIHATGDDVGGHCILARGINVRSRTVLLHQSWGPKWGVHGTARLPWDDLGDRLDNQGECCVPVVR
jgi:hypothetical protein